MSYDYFYGQSGELFSYFRIPKALFQDSRFRQLSTDARTLCGILLDRMSLSAKNNWLDEQGRVYIIYTVREVQESLCCAEHKAVKLFRELEQANLIERKRRGLGRPSLIYVKNFSSGLPPKAQVQNCANSNSCAAENAVQVQPKPQSNKTDKNKTERNNPFLPDESDREQLEDYFYQALEVELLLRLCPDDEDTIYQIVDLLVDTCSTKRKMLRIAGDDKPTEVVRSRLKKLNADHIRFVLGCLAENTSPVRNMKQYLLAALFNAPTTMNVQVAKLKVLKADHQSQKFRLEDKLLTKFPADIQETNAYLAGVKADAEVAAAHPQEKEGFCGIIIKGVTYNEKKTAGERLLLACSELPNSEEKVIGSYRGFELSLRFDTYYSEYQALLKGQRKYPVALGKDPLGCIIRLDNSLNNFPERITSAENELATLKQQQEAAQIEVEKPFPQEEELAEKSARLAELNAQLDMDEKGHEPEQDEEEQEDEPRRPSVLAALEEKADKTETVKPFKSFLDKDGDAR